jgi:hypothetical protein
MAVPRSRGGILHAAGGGTWRGAYRRLRVRSRSSRGQGPPADVRSAQSLAAPASRRLGRAGLEALPLRARKFLSFSHRENAKIPSKLVPHIGIPMLSQGSANSRDAKLRIKATLEFWTFQPPLQRPGLRGKHRHWGHWGSCTRTQRASLISQHTACTRPARARRAAAVAACAREGLTATSIEACRRSSSPAVGMSMPEARTRVTPFDW